MRKQMISLSVIALGGAMVAAVILGMSGILHVPLLAETASQSRTYYGETYRSGSATGLGLIVMLLGFVVLLWGFSRFHLAMKKG